MKDTKTLEDLAKKKIEAIIKKNPIFKDTSIIITLKSTKTLGV